MNADFNIPDHGSFTDKNGKHVGRGDLVSYEWDTNPRNYRVVNIFQDGDAWVYDEETKTYIMVKWCHLVKEEEK